MTAGWWVLGQLISSFGHLFTREFTSHVSSDGCFMLLIIDPSPSRDARAVVLEEECLPGANQEVVDVLTRKISRPAFQRSSGPPNGLQWLASAPACKSITINKRTCLPPHPALSLVNCRGSSPSKRWKRTFPVPFIAFRCSRQYQRPTTKHSGRRNSPSARRVADESDSDSKRASFRRTRMS